MTARPAPAPYPRKELIRRLRSGTASCARPARWQSIRSAARRPREPGPGQPAWAVLMAKKRRKSLIVCAVCHDWIHANPVAHAA